MFSKFFGQSERPQPPRELARCGPVPLTADGRETLSLVLQQAGTQQNLFLVVTEDEDHEQDHEYFLVQPTQLPALVQLLQEAERMVRNVGTNNSNPTTATASTPLPLSQRAIERS